MQALLSDVFRAVVYLRDVRMLHLLGQVKLKQRDLKFKCSLWFSFTGQTTGRPTGTGTRKLLCDIAESTIMLESNGVQSDPKMSVILLRTKCCLAALRCPRSCTSFKTRGWIRPPWAGCIHSQWLLLLWNLSSWLHVSSYICWYSLVRILDFQYHICLTVSP